MSVDGLQRIAYRIRADERVVRQLQQFPEEVCREYPLSADELEALQTGDETALIELGLSPPMAARIAAIVRYWGPVPNAASFGIGWETAEV